MFETTNQLGFKEAKMTQKHLDLTFSGLWPHETSWSMQV
jgi:hypothetical protein